ncbi:putative cytosolic iron-sulfur protein assembly protein Ciao1 isoform X1 [Histomonas meleagridis]|uniref:putative cytosolic iron-sulfur protein assembly protein Ciao1 isoform X1 n=1 Tax=Histomonas meleagridis TaxID=135588 RepID=UPI00355964D5|nr:putative cytosolic iron-sulfur protein assembly protein Ciao1 isoform X1 [Histomonas meleagridis]KAH0807099.1 putative cytosolic iron-sulfur protein assembly protein Ciao1 isoform X1 [Histomonas meleagridis]
MALVEERDSLILDLSWHPSGNFIATVGSDGILHVFSCENEKFTKIFQFKKSRSLRRCEWSPNGQHLAIACFDGKATIFEFSQENLQFKNIGNLEGQENEIKTVRWSSDGNYLVTCGRDKSAWVWSFKDLDFTTINSEHTADVKDAAFSPSGLLFASVSFDGSTKIWDPSSELGSLQTFCDHKGTVWSLAFNPENSDLATIGEDGKVTLYRTDGENYSKLNQISLQEELDPLYSIVFVDGYWVAAGADRILYFVDPECTKVVREVKTKHIGDINCAKPNPINPRKIATGSDDGTVIIIDV